MKKLCLGIIWIILLSFYCNTIFSTENFNNLIDAIQKKNIDEVKKILKKAKKDGSLSSLLEEKMPEPGMFSSKKNSQNTPLHEAIEQGSADIAKLLITEKPDIIHLINNQGFDASKMATEKAFALGDSNDLMRFILEHETDPGYQSGYYKNTPLHWAVKIGDTELVNKFLDQKPNIIDIKNFDHATPLHWAVIFTNAEMVKLLLKRKANIEAKTYNGQTALDLAKDMALDNIIEILSDNQKENDAAIIGNFAQALADVK